MVVDRNRSAFAIFNKNRPLFLAIRSDLALMRKVSLLAQPPASATLWV
jgi:hypothetical protein